ncbi:unnamed protein product [Leuciscus chuanchicus]
MDEMRKDDLLTACNSGPLSTDQKRKMAFKKHFNYVEPVPQLLGINEKVEEKHFNYTQFNRCKDQFNYQGNDAHDKPADVSPGSRRLSGHAVQNWCFLCLLPLLIGDRIRNPCENAAWQLVLQLREIVELICAPAITTDQVAYLKILIEDSEYIYFRRQLFPNEPLKSKHHYLLYYPELITHFGPLIRLWTLRFESKHTFFKRCARKLHNFKNICKTVAERHQLFQAYLSAGVMFQPTVLLDKEMTFYVNDYSDKIREAVVGLYFESKDTVASHTVTVKGTSYKKGMFILLGKTEEELERHGCSTGGAQEGCLGSTSGPPRRHSNYLDGRPGVTWCGEQGGHEPSKFLLSPVSSWLSTTLLNPVPRGKSTTLLT